MNRKIWITSLAVTTLALGYVGLGFAQQPTADPSTTRSNIIDKGLGVSMTSPSRTDGTSITTADQPTVQRWTGTSMTQPLRVDGTPMDSTTSFGQRGDTSIQR
ncbi:MAG TPA: hypothetical protein VEH80_07455 [Candidatus Bathyarchaeia archaeon]|nr:hypothetical protein [Candidatus Bathyarchaeia archaeon]